MLEFRQSMGARNRVKIGLSYRFIGIDSWAPKKFEIPTQESIPPASAA